MFILKKIITPLILPPGCFIVVLLVAGTRLVMTRRRAGGVICLVTGLLLWVASLQYTATLLVGGLEQGLGFPRELRGDVIVLLGGGVNDDVKDLTGRGSPSDDMMGRMVTAVRVQRRTGLPIIVSGGASLGVDVAEAKVVQRLLVDLGVPPGKVIMEERSKDTVDNARFVREICASHGFRHPLLVTSAYHMKRSLMSFRRYGVEVTPVPAGFRAPDHPKIGLLWPLPSLGALNVTTSALHEYLGMLFYRLTLPRAESSGGPP